MPSSCRTQTLDTVRHIASNRGRGCTKNIQKLLWCRNHSSGNITHRPDNYSTSFLLFCCLPGLMPRVLRHGKSYFHCWPQNCPKRQSRENSTSLTGVLSCPFYLTYKCTVVLRIIFVPHNSRLQPFWLDHGGRGGYAHTGAPGAGMTQPSTHRPTTGHGWCRPRTVLSDFTVGRFATHVPTSQKMSQFEICGSLIYKRLYFHKLSTRLTQYDV